MIFSLLLLITGNAWAATLRGATTPLPQGRPSGGIINSREYLERRRLQQQKRELGLFDWELGPVDGYPQIGNEYDGNQDIVFLYNFTGDITDPKRSLVVGIFQDDCETPAPTDALAPLTGNETLTVEELQVDVNMNVATIPDSVFFTYMDSGTKATIDFCLRVNYEYDGEGVNFHETVVSINIDLTAGFNITAITTREDSDNTEVEVNIGCDVYEYFCNDLYEDIGQPTFSQGDIMQACITSVGDFNIRDIMEADLDQDKDRDGLWDTHDDLVNNFTALPLTEKTCSLGRCNIKTQLRAKYFTERNPNNLTISGVAICGFGKSPTVIFCGGGTKPTVAENSTFVTYPLLAALNDVDGTDVWDEITIQYSTPGVGGGFEPPAVDFLYKSDSVAYDTSTPGLIRLTGDSSEMEDSVQTMQIRPGISNGEDILIEVSATASSLFNPTVKITSTDSCTIPVDPVVQGGLTLEVPVSVEFNEDTKYTLQGFNSVFDGEADVDESETTVMEIEVSSYPTGTRFWANGALMTTTSSGWLQIPANAMSTFQIRPPGHYSGSFDLVVRSAITDSTQTGVVVLATGTKTVPFRVLPRADGVSFQSVIGIEDLGPISFGTQVNSGLTIRDRGSGTGNNPETETITQIVIDIPADTAEVTYTITGAYAQDITGSLPGPGTATVSFDATLREYSITSTITEGQDFATLSQADRETAMTDIRDAFKTFLVEIGPEHNADNGSIAVTVHTADVNIGVSHEKTDSYTPLIVAAVADLPTVSVVNPAEVTVSEDGDSIPLRITVGHSLDRDDSEVISVRITVPTEGGTPIGTIGGATPANVNLADQGGGSYLVTATGATPEADEALLNSFLSEGGNIIFIPRAGWAGSVVDTDGIRVDVISTETATGDELAGDEYGGADGTSKTETATAYIGLTVLPVADEATITVKGNSVGLEDTVNEVPISVSLGDLDGSETFVLQITSVTPSGCVLYGAGGAELTPVDGTYTLQPDDVDAFAFLPPLHFSTPVQGTVVFETTTIVTDAAAGTTSQSTADLTITVTIEGVADKPNSKSVHVTGNEDEAYDLGSAIDTTGVLVDTDGSEVLYMLLKGLPGGIFPTSTSGPVTYIGNGGWQVSFSAIPNLVLPAVNNYSGENPLPDLTLQAVAQELDGDEAVSDPWPITFDIYPVVDGFSSWSMATSVTEGENEGGGSGISLASASGYSFQDSDGSEEAIECTFDLSSLITDAGIAVRLSNLSGSGTGLTKLVNNYLQGDFTYNEGVGTITVAPNKISTIALDATLFLDSNEDFSIPVSMLVRDSATINGQTETSETVEEGSLSVNLIGTADTPSVSAESAEGDAGVLIPLNLGGDTTDTDVALGRSQSEGIYYILTELPAQSTTSFEYTLVNAGGSVVGHDHEGHWLLFPEDLPGLHILVPRNGGTLAFRHSTVALENDGDMATNSIEFQVQVNATAGGLGNLTLPLPPTLEIGTTIGVEDTAVILNVSAFADPEDPTNPTVTIAIFDLPAGAQVNGATLNPFNNRWVASADDVRSGRVTLTPPDDLGGDMYFSLEAVSTTAYGLSASTGPQNTTAYLDPVADGASISCVPSSSVEDATIALDVSLQQQDGDGSEQAGTSLYVKITNNAEMVSAYPLVGSGDPDASLGGVNLQGYYRVPVADMDGILLQPTAHWNGNIALQLAVPIYETEDDEDADYMTVSTSSHSIQVTAQADQALLTVPATTVTGDEDTAIAIPDLSVTPVDTDGSEVLSATLSGLPSGTLLSHGENNGDGSWVIPVNELSLLTVTPPLNFAGTMSLALNAYTLELSNGDEAVATQGFTVEVSPVADSYLIVAHDVSTDALGKATLDLSLRLLDDNGDSAGELPAELVQLTLDNLPTGARVLPGLGGTLSHSGQSATFVGSEDQANNLFIVTGPGTAAGSYQVSISGITIDNGSVLADPVLDSFKLTVGSPTGAGQTYTGTTVANNLSGSSGNDEIDAGTGDDTLSAGAGYDYLIGGPGLDTMTGGSETDVYGWSTGDLGSEVDRITDFVAGVGGDILDLHALWDTAYDWQASDISSFVQLGGDAGGIVVAVDTSGAGASFQDLVLLEGVTGVTVETMLANGNILV